MADVKALSASLNFTSLKRNKQESREKCLGIAQTVTCFPSQSHRSLGIAITPTDQKSQKKIHRSYR